MRYDDAIQLVILIGIPRHTGSQVSPFTKECLWKKRVNTTIDHPSVSKAGASYIRLIYAAIGSVSALFTSVSLAAT